MRTVTLRHVAPALIVVCEVEAPSRVVLALDGPGEVEALARWTNIDMSRSVLAEVALDLRGDEGVAWSRLLDREAPPGDVAFVARRAVESLAAERAMLRVASRLEGPQNGS